MHSLIRTTLASAALLAFNCAATAASGAVVWDQGPATGLTTGSFVNETDGQNFADAVRFDADTVVTGLNFFTGERLAAHSGAYDFRIKFLADAANAPGALMMSTDVGFVSSAFDVTPDINEYRFTFAPVTLRAATTYWVGVSGIGFDAGQAAVAAPGDGQMAQFAGGTLQYQAVPVGDQMFQLTSAVPEPQTYALLLAGVALIVSVTRKKNASDR
ncbi:hypothetical protein BH11PSE9_BH11PSE9_22720 [soil metagenome]